MPKNVDGEFEVLLGNKQLLSVFFIVVILLAVFFTMGYIVGRSTGPGAESPRAATTPPAAVAQMPQSGFADTPVQEPREEAGQSSPAAAPESAAKAGTQPQQKLPAAAPPKSSPAVSAAATTPSAAPFEPAAGQVYLQAVAGKRPDAELVASVLKRKGFPVLVAPGPNESVFRVLVGPFSDSAAMGKTRTELEAAGFKAFPRKY